MHVTACFKLIINSYLYLYFGLSSFLDDSWRVRLVAVSVAFEAVWTHRALSLSPPPVWGFRCKPPYSILLVIVCLRKFSSLSFIKDSFAGKGLSVGDISLSLYYLGIPFSASCKGSAEKSPDRQCWNSLLKRDVSYLLLLLDCFVLWVWVLYVIVCSLLGWIWLMTSVLSVSGWWLLEIPSIISKFFLVLLPLSIAPVMWVFALMMTHNLHRYSLSFFLFLCSSYLFCPVEFHWRFLLSFLF